ncbi:uncharacterized protein LOC126668303 [Mercurialis annua]|uniref:uncharacterized protein LOC126668303 n=1 Tax=Mercurialis annua TaxID=3986 RepID=UPI00215EB26D|nr:uncharacterized protein LOC126668303 [Mercurialis annua]
MEILEKLCVPKSEGGMGFKRLRVFNLALLGKQAWRFLVHPNVLVSQIFKAKYYPNFSFSKASFGSNPSLIWRGIHETQNLICSGLKYTVGNGESISIWRDFWIFDELFGEEIRRHILRISISNKTVSDRLAWLFEDRSIYTVKSYYKRLSNVAEVGHNILWKHLVNLAARRVTLDSRCRICHLNEETLMHTLIDYGIANDCWSVANLGMMLRGFSSFKEVLLHFFENDSTDNCNYMAMICWQLWKNRNSIVWKNFGMTTRSIVNLAGRKLYEWSSSRVNLTVKLLKQQKEWGKQAGQNPSLES